ncbi:MAG: helix-turn-helix domain-containing protein, partial [Dehalococcoidia bacterium]|nr:helix-turn-helix domain-containing protein [Dehalococcoidia bacterium]
TRTEYELFRALVANAGATLTHEQLIERVWGPDHPIVEASLRTFIKQLRKKIEPDPAAPKHIRTIAGIGYRFQP